VSLLLLFNQPSSAGPGPTFLSASISPGGATILVTFLIPGTSPLLPASGVTGFTVKVNGVTDAITAATSSGNVVTLTLITPIVPGQEVTLAYAPGNLTDSSSNSAVGFGAINIPNGSGINIGNTLIAPGSTNGALTTYNPTGGLP
jgi:hypothetical protein